jgi:hypothetical protein
MSPTRVELQQVQNVLRGRKVVRARRLPSACLLVYFSAGRGGTRMQATQPCLMVELARWSLGRGRSVVTSRSGVRVTRRAVAKVAGRRVSSARLGPDGIELAFGDGLALRVQTLTPTELGPGWRAIDQWLLFMGDGSAIVQRVRGRLAWIEASIQ